MQTIITRIWHGTTKSEDADEYLDFLKVNALRDYKSIPGNIGAEIWRRKDGAICHFWAVSKWETIESIKTFAGEAYEKARYYPEDKRFLLEFEENVIHCETYYS